MNPAALYRGALFSLVLTACVSSGLAQSSLVIKQSLKSVVMIIAFDEEAQPTGIGSGFVVNDKGDIVTNYHVLEKASAAVVRLVGVDKKYPVTMIVRKNAKDDLLVIRAEGLSAPALNLGDDIFQEVGDRIIAIGNPKGFSGTVSEGIISGFRKVDSTSRMMQITAPISPGSSGGPVLAQNGKVIGIATATVTAAQNLNFAVPVTKLKTLLESPASNQTVSSRNLAPVQKSAFKWPQVERKVMVECKSIRASSYISSFELSAVFSNNHNNDIKDIKAIVRFKDRQGKDVHFEAVKFTGTIPSKFTKTITKRVYEDISTSGYTPVVTIVDYEVLPTSGKLEFK